MVYTKYIKIFIALTAFIIIGIIGVVAWNLKGDSYRSFLSQINAKTLPFKVLTPSYISPEFKFLKEASVKIVKGNIGIPQINYMFETPDGKNGLVLRQMDKSAFQKPQTSTKEIERDGKKIYIRIPTEKVRSVFGDMQYIASAQTLNDDSFILLNYSGEIPFSEEELIKILLSLK